MAFTVIKCEANRGSITILYSEPVDNSGIARGNYSVTDPGNPAVPSNPDSVTMLDPSTVVLLYNIEQFSVGDWVQVKISAVKSSSSGNAVNTTVAGLVGERGGRGIREAVEDAVAYPLLTEPVSFGSPSVGPMPSGVGAASGAPLGNVVNKALADVLGWKINSSDSKGFVGALTQSFTLSDVEGHTVAQWTPRSYAVQTDLAGGITGAQASLYTRAQDAMDKCGPLLDGLYPLDPEADAEDVSALRDLAKSQMAEIVKEFGAVGGPSVLRVNTYFNILLGTSTAVPKDADSLTGGTLATLRDTYGLKFLNNPLSNSIEDEQDITNLRIIVDYVSSLLQTWINNQDFFKLGSGTQQAFFGTQLVLISRQLSVILETVNEVRFALDSVFIGPSERQTLLIQFRDDTPSTFLEDMLNEFVDFFGDEAPRLIQDGGRLAVKNNILPVVCSFKKLASGARNPANIRSLPDGFRTVRVRRTLDDLFDQISELEKLSTPVGRDVPPPEGGIFAFPPQVDFGTVQVGDQTKPITVTVANLAPTPIASLTATTDVDSPFQVTNVDPKKLAPMAMAAVSVVFKAPYNPPSVSTTLNINADGRIIPVTLVAKVGGISPDAAGLGPGRLVAIPTAIDFETVAIGAQAARKTLTLMNVGGTDVSGVTVASSDPTFTTKAASDKVSSMHTVGIDITANAPHGTQPAQRNTTLTIKTDSGQKLEINLSANLAYAAGTN
jgi:hypothetical protein